MSATSFLLLILLPATALISLYVVWPLLRRRDDAQILADESAELNRAVIRERRARLEAELADLPADSPEREALIREFSAAALADLQPARPQQVAADIATQPAEQPGAAQPTTADGLAPANSAARSQPRVLLATVFLVALVALPIAFYRTTGMPEAVQPDFAQQAGQPNVEALLATLEARLAAEPERADGWLMLGRSRMALGQTEAALAALEKALQVDSTEPQLAAQIRVDLADALGRKAGNQLSGRPWALIQEALAKFPNHPKAMALAGAYQVSRKDYQAALGYWEPLLGMLEPGTGPHQQIAQQIAQVRAQAGLPPLDIGSASGAAGGSGPMMGQMPPGGQAPASGPSGTAPANGPVLSGEVGLAASLAAAAQADETVFLAVRSADESGEPAGPPLAVKRIRVADLPHRFSFSDADAMGPMGRLSSSQRVIVIARVSKSGQPTPQPGDLEGRSAVLANDATGVRIQIDRQR